MGARQSKSQEIISTDKPIGSASANTNNNNSNDNVSSKSEASPPIKVNDNNNDEVTQQEDVLKSSSGGGCPMKNKSGSYWGGFFNGGKNPHVGPNAIPMSTSKDNDNKTNQPQKESLCPVKKQPSSSGGGCPVKGNKTDKVQYNVYSQPIDPNNNMPAVENQLPAAQQKEYLSTERVSSTIPKVQPNNVFFTT